MLRPLLMLVQYNRNVFERYRNWTSVNIAVQSHSQINCTMLVERIRDWSRSKAWTQSRVF